MPKKNKKQGTKPSQAEIDANWYKNLKLTKPVGKPSISRKKITQAVREVMKEDATV